MLLSYCLFALIMPEQFNPYPLPKMEEDIDRNGDWQEEAVEAQAAGTGAALGEALIHGGIVEKSTKRDNRNQHSDGWQGKHSPGLFFLSQMSQLC